jgi:hypothetical protein
MSIYVQLLDAALAEGPPPPDEMTTDDAFAELLRHRGNLYSSSSSKGRSSQGESLWAPDAVANELAYDMALIRLARLLGIECDTHDFELPGRGRARVELSLMSKGISLGDSGTSKATG